MTSVVPPPPPTDQRRRVVRSRRRAAVRTADPTALRGAVLAAAAAVGVLVGLGVRSGASLGRFGVVPLRLRGLPEFVAPDRGALAPAMLGALHVTVVAGVWGAASAALAAAIARRVTGRRGRVLPAVAPLVTAAAMYAADPALPAAARLAAGSLTGGERALTAVLVAVAGAAAAWRATSPRPAR